MSDDVTNDGRVQQPQAAKQLRLDKSDNPGDGEYGEVPNLAARVIVGVFDAAHAAQNAVSALHAAGYSDDDVSLVAPHPGAAPETSADETAAGAGSVAGVTAGAIAGAALAGLAAIVIPGIGALLAIGPLAAALSGAAVGGALGGLIGSLTGLGIPTEQAQEYEQYVRSGKSIVTTRTENDEQSASVERLLNEHGAISVHSYQESL